LELAFAGLLEQAVKLLVLRLEEFLHLGLLLAGEIQVAHDLLHVWRPGAALAAASRPAGAAGEPSGGARPARSRRSARTGLRSSRALAEGWWTARHERVAGRLRPNGEADGWTVLDPGDDLTGRFGRGTVVAVRQPAEDRQRGPAHGDQTLAG